MKFSKTLSYLSLITIILFLSIGTFGQTIAPTPPMGWMSWNQFEGDISEQIVKEIADAIVNTGLAEAGYTLISIDDHWEGGRTDEGFIYPDPEKFPNGMKAVGDYIHAKGLKFGIYTDIAEFTCGGEVGSLNYEEQDAQTFAEWGVDFIKCDYCGAPKDLWTAIERYEKFIKAVRETDREIVFAICEWGQRAPWLWGKKVDGNMWRTTWDLRDTWESNRYYAGAAGIMEVLDRQVGLSKHSGPGHWNDPDMLMIGLNGNGKSSNSGGAKGCTVTEYEAQMGLWCLLASPLLLCNDIRDMDSDTKRIVTNKELIAINQDPLGKQADRFWKDGDIEIWARPLSDGSWAVGLLNRSHERSREITLDYKLLRLKNGAKVRDVWKGKDLGFFDKEFTAIVDSHACLVFKIFPE